MSSNSSLNDIYKSILKGASDYTINMGNGNRGLGSTHAVNFEKYQIDLTGTVNSDLLIYQNGTRYDGNAGTDTFYADWSALSTSVKWTNDTGASTIDLGNGQSIKANGIERLLITTGAGDDVIINNVSIVTFDTIITGAGNDTLDGGTGNDIMTGGTGNDIYYVRDKGDTVTELTGSGTDTIYSYLTNYKLGSNVENGSIMQINAGIIGNTLNNVLTGGDGNNGIDGNSGNDILTGGKGKDIFKFTTTLSTSKAENIDTITDFNVADDTIQLENAIFNKLKVTGVLKADNFVSNNSGTAMDANDYIVYDKDGGILFYDADASGKGVAIQIAIIGANLELSAANFIVI